jgi:hypothetical protein
MHQGSFTPSPYILGLAREGSVVSTVDLLIEVVTSHHITAQGNKPINTQLTLVGIQVTHQGAFT